jgi:hypothetical protein
MNDKGKQKFGFFDFIPQSIVFFILFNLVGLKIFFWLVLQFPSFDIYASGNDSELYHLYAIGNIDNAPNLWPKILRFLHDLGLYHRSVISFFMLLTTVTVVPTLALIIIRTEAPNYDGGGYVKKVQTYCLLFIMAYPSVFIFSLDIYRDALMLNVVMLCLFAVQKFLIQKDSRRYLFLLVFFFFNYVAYGLREYLGAAIFGAFICFTFLKWAKVNGMHLVIGVIVMLVIAHQLGWLDLIILYRGDDGFETGSTSFGIGLIGANTAEFLMLVGLSLLYQVVGLYVTGPVLVVIFLCESLPVLLMIRHIRRYAEFISPFGYYLLTFLIIYTFIWVIGNDNMGTAMRLRMPTYIGIAILFGSVEIRRVKMTA